MKRYLELFFVLLMLATTGCTAAVVAGAAGGGYAVGVLVQSNFGGILTVGGAPVGKELGRYYLREFTPPPEQAGGSCMIVVATDAPLGPTVARLALEAAARAVEERDQLGAELDQAATIGEAGERIGRRPGAEVGVAEVGLAEV